MQCLIYSRFASRQVCVRVCAGWCVNMCAVVRGEMDSTLFFSSCCCVITEMDVGAGEPRGLFAARRLHPTVPLVIPQGEEDLVSGETIPD